MRGRIGPFGGDPGWYPYIRRLRALLLFPPPEVRAVFHDLRELGLVG